MTGLESIVAKELVLFAAKAIWDMVNSDDNDLKSEQAKAHAKAGLNEISEDARRAFKFHLPAEFKL
jgi:phage-related minor tail protein